MELEEKKMFDLNEYLKLEQIGKISDRNDLLTVYNKIIDEMKKEMPEPWYNYGIELKD